MQDLGQLVSQPSRLVGIERDDPRDGAGAVAVLPEARLKVACPPRPILPQDLGGALAWFANPHPEAGPRWDLVTPRVEATAKKVLPIMRARCRFATLAELRVFFATVAKMAPNAPTGAGFESFVVEAECGVLRNTPVGALVETVAECQAERYFPKGEALKRIVVPVGMRMLRELAAMERIAAVDTLAKARAAERAANPPPTDEQRAAVRERLLATERQRQDDEREARARRLEAVAATHHRQPNEREARMAMLAELEELEAVSYRTPPQESRWNQLALRLLNQGRTSKVTVEEWLASPMEKRSNVAKMLIVTAGRH